MTSYLRKGESGKSAPLLGESLLYPQGKTPLLNHNVSLVQTECIYDKMEDTHTHDFIDKFKTRWPGWKYRRRHSRTPKKRKDVTQEDPRIQKSKQRSVKLLDDIWFYTVDKHHITSFHPKDQRFLLSSTSPGFKEWLSRNGSSSLRKTVQGFPRRSHWFHPLWLRL